MNILIEGYFDRNFGDDMMFRIIADQLCEHKLFISENRKELLLPFENIANIYDLQDYHDIKIDVVLRITGSGFLIVNKIGIYYSILRLLKAAKHRKTKLPMAVIGCNVGPFVNRLAEIISVIEMKKYNLITVREKYSYDYTNRKAKGIPVYHFPDIVFSLPEQWIPKKNDKNCLGISVYRKANKNNLEVYKKLAQIADAFISKHNKKVLLFAFDVENENDIAAALATKELCKNKEMVETVFHIDNGDTILNGMARCRQILSIRFHSAVLALRMNIPFVPIIYSKKTDNMLNDLGYNGDRFYLESFQPSEVLAALDKEYSFSLDKKIIEDAKNHAAIFQEKIVRGEN